MITLPNSEVVFADDIHPYIEDHGLVTVLGDSPSATVKISVPHRKSKRFVEVDRITGATVNQRGGTWEISGRSQHLRNTVRTGDQKLTIQVTPEPGCADCGKR